MDFCMAEITNPGVGRSGSPTPKSMTLTPLSTALFFARSISTKRYGGRRFSRSDSSRKKDIFINTYNFDYTDLRTDYTDEVIRESGAQELGHQNIGIPGK